MAPYSGNMDGRFPLRLALVLAGLALSFWSVSAQEVLFREEFESLKNWKPLTFRNIDRHSEYSVVTKDERTALQMTAENSASAMVYTRTFDVYEWPVLSWVWRAESVHPDGDATKKTGDDYPVRLYVLFEYAPERLSLPQKLQYNAVKLLYGRYPPHATLNYIYANQSHEHNVIPNPFSDRAMMIVADSGSEHVGEWRRHTVHIVEDYRRAFGTDPPATATIAVMGDADNTGGASTAYVDSVTVSATD